MSGYIENFSFDTPFLEKLVVFSLCILEFCFILKFVTLISQKDEFWWIDVIHYFNTSLAIFESYSCNNKDNINLIEGFESISIGDVYLLVKSW